MLKQLFSLEGRSALIVGGGKVPCAIAALFRDAGAQVEHERDADLSESAVEALYAPLSDLDILVNGAVRTGPWPIEKLSMQEWDRVHDVNVRGAFLLMRAAVTAMRAHGRGGRLINISTIGAEHPVLNGNFAYSSSRAGTNALTRQFALEFAKLGILSNAIMVGAIPSDPFPKGCALPPTGPIMEAGRLPLGQGAPEDVAPLALLLASDAGRYINGQTIAVDGGFQIA